MIDGSSKMAWDLTADILVVGSGAAAFSAACTAASKGRTVLILEKAAIYGGTTAKSGGQYWIPNNSLMRRHGLQDPEDWALKLMVRLSWPTRYDPASPTLGISAADFAMIRTFYRRASEATDYLTGIGALEPCFASFPAMGGANEDQNKAINAWPDYAADLPECRAPYGRSLCPLGGGGAMIKTFKKNAERAGAKLLIDHAVNRIYRNRAGEVVGVGVLAGGRQLAVRAGRGVIFGSGGFTHNAQMRNDFLRGLVLNGCGVPTNTGDFVSLGSAVGASLGNMNNAWWLEQPLEVAITAPGASAEIFFIPGDSVIAVNRCGSRIVNEKIAYNERAQVHFAWDAVAREYPNFITYMIFDEAAASRDPLTYATPPYPIPSPGVEAPYVIKGATLEELASNVRARLTTLATHTGGATLAEDFADQLRGTISRFNNMANAGKDLDFQRGESLQQLMMSGPARPGSTLKNPTMYPLSEHGPYYCVPLIAGTLDTKGGPRINVDGQVLNVDNDPIPGLYGAGNCIASPTAQAYWSGGATIGTAITFGYLAGLHASARAESVL